MNIQTGNIDLDSDSHSETKGWIVGDFISPQSLLHSEKCEVKWIRRKAGIMKPSERTCNKDIVTLVILLSGKWLISFPELQKEHILSQPGDYVAYEFNYHESTAIEDSHIIVIRWNNGNRD